MQPRSIVETAEQQLNVAFGNLAQRSTNAERAALAFIYNKIKQFHLNCDIFDIVNECYLRGLKQTQSGQEIKNHLAWIRQTAYNIIREKSRYGYHKKESSSSHFLETYLSENPLDDAIQTCLDQPEWPQLKKAFAELSSEDQDILKLRWFHNMSWQDVSQELSKLGESISTSTANKRGQRALKRLRKQYYTQVEKEKIIP